MQFSEIQAAVNDDLETSHFTNWTADLTKRWINRAVRWACEGQVVLPQATGILPLTVSHDFSFLTNEVQAGTIDEQRKYDLPDGSTADIWEWRKDKNIELIDASNYRVPLRKFHKRDIEDDPLFALLTGKGTPSHFCIEQFKLWLFCLPDHEWAKDPAWEYFDKQANKRLLEMITNDQGTELGGIERGMQPTAGAKIGA